ncbi:MAG: YlqD family protein [Bacillota bacterium]|nr:MAG: 16S rRNA processing protein RimM [Bacillota bacterium]
MNNKIQILRPVTVRARVTPALKARLKQEVEAEVRQLDLEVQELETQLKRAQLTMTNMTPQQQLQLRQAVDLEKQKRQAEKEALLERLREIEALPLGSEILQGTVQAVAEVGVGDDLESLLATEIVVEDGRIIAIRRG